MYYRSGFDYACLLDFLLVIKTIETSLKELGMSDDPDIKLENELDERNLNRCVSETFVLVREKFEALFNKAYNIREKF